MLNYVTWSPNIHSSSICVCNQYNLRRRMNHLLWRICQVACNVLTFCIVWRAYIALHFSLHTCNTSVKLCKSTHATNFWDLSTMTLFPIQLKKVVWSIYVRIRILPPLSHLHNNLSPYKEDDDINLSRDSS